MDDEEIPSHILSGPDLSSMASDEKIAAGRDMARRFAMKCAMIESMEERLKVLKKEREELARREIPEFFDGTLHTDKIGVPEAGVDVVVEPYYHANIRSDWSELDRQAGFQYLEKKGHGDVVSVVLTVEFGRRELALARELEEMIRRSRFGNEHPPKLEMSVPWATLTALVKKEVESGRTLDLSVLGATVGRTAKIKKRK